MLLPKKTKYRKAFKGRIHGNAKRGSSIAFGSFGLKALEPERVTSRQIEAARKAINRYLRRAGKLWIRVFPDVPVSQKPAEVRMGSGKGSVEYYICRVKPGRILFELEGVTSAQAEEAFRLASGKLPIKTKFVERIVEVEDYDLDGINKNYIDTIDKNKVKEVNLDADDKVIKQNTD